MDLVNLTEFFMWCSIINGALLLFWGLFVIVMPDITYRLQSVFFTISRESFDKVIYMFLGLFKMMFLFFNLVPYLALLIITTG